MFHTIKYDMTKKQVRKLSLEYSDMAAHQKFSLNVTRKHRAAVPSALEEPKPWLLYTCTKQLPEDPAPQPTAGEGNESRAWTGSRVPRLSTLSCCMNILPAWKIKCKSKATEKAKRLLIDFIIPC